MNQRMISLRSIYLFLFINGFLVGFGSFQYFLTLFYPFSIPFLFVMKNVSLLSIINSLSFTHPYTQAGKRMQLSIKELFLSACMETAGYAIIPYVQSTEYTNELLFFIPRTFVFEIVFDFWHYWAHRISHMYAFVYKFHSVHHSHLISSYTTFHHHPVDLLFTNALPMYLTMLLIPLPQYTFIVFLWYKTWIEIGGHVGKHVRTPSFPQCIWLPKAFGIELYSRNHEQHHIQPWCNFSKRFSLWDKVFGTYSVQKKE